MELTSRIYFIYDGKNNYFLKFTLEKNLSDFIILFKQYKLKNYNDVILKTVKQKIEDEPFNDDILKKVDSDIVLEGIIKNSKILTKYCDYLKSCLEKYINENILYTIDIPQSNTKIYLYINQIRRLYLDLKSINDNLITINIIYNIVKKNIGNNINKENIIKETVIHNLENNISKEINNIDLNVETNKEEYTILDKIISFSISNTIKTSLIHYILTYFPYMNYFCNNENESVKINITSVIPITSIFQKDLILSLISSIDKSNEEIKHNSIKLINIIYLNEYKIRENKIYLASILFMFLINILKFLYNLNQDYVLKNYESWFIDLKLLNKLINYYINNFSLEDFKDKLKIDFHNNLLKEEDSEKFNEIKEKNKHLLNFDSIKYSELLYNLKIKNKFPCDFKFNNKRIINISNYKYDSKSESLLNYNINGNITELYNIFINYIKQPNYLILNKVDNKYIDVLKLFDCLKKIVNKEIFNENNINTLSYYIILVEKFGEQSKLLNHVIFLKIIFHIIIPYYYDMYKIKEFEDYLLN